MSAAAPSTSASSDRAFLIFNAALSTAALAFLSWLLLAPRAAASSDQLSFVPAVNACFNTLSACCLVAGWRAIRAGRRDLHRFLMVAAFVASCLFLIGYVAYHSVHGDTKFAGHGGIKVAYLAILATHVLLSMAVPPLALAALYFALRGRFTTHKRITRIALPVWLYVSVTGVLIYFLLYVWYAPPTPVG